MCSERAPLRVDETGRGGAEAARARRGPMNAEAENASLPGTQRVHVSGKPCSSAYHSFGERAHALEWAGIPDSEPTRVAGK